MNRGALTIVLVLSVAGSVACDGGGNDAQAYCDKIAEFEEEGTEPTVEEGQELLELAPDEIRDDIEVITNALAEFEETQDPSAVQGTEVLDALQNTNEWEEENCE